MFGILTDPRAMAGVVILAVLLPALTITLLNIWRDGKGRSEMTERVYKEWYVTACKMAGLIVEEKQ